MPNIEKKTAQLAAEAIAFGSAVDNAFLPRGLADATERDVHELAGTLEAHLLLPLAHALYIAAILGTCPRVIARSRNGNVRSVPAELSVVQGEAACGCTKIWLVAKCVDAEVGYPTTIASLTYGRGTAVLTVMPHYSITGPRDYELDDIAPVTSIHNYGLAVLA